MIYEKLQKCRVELQRKNLKKSGKNKYAGFEYFELKDFLPTINVMFAEKKMFSNFSMNETSAELIIVDIEDKSEVIFCTPVAKLELKGCNEIQALGGVHTYLKRYLYMNALEIVENDMFVEIVENDMFEATSGKNENKTDNVVICPKCGKKTSARALETFGVCSSCKQKEKQNENI